jgi:4-amino-4-deoxy-L-arabinose transferase-like glycosyltransferase
MRSMSMPFSKKELIFLVLIILVASCLRLYRLDEIPPGLCGDTAYKGIAASRIVQGEYPIFFAESWGGIEPMYMYILAVFFYFVGTAPLMIQALSAMIGIITIPILYLLARELFNSRIIGLLTSSWLAVSYWHVSWSRLGWESILVPLFVTITVYFLWRGLKSGHWKEFIWAGLSLGAGLYTYQAMRFFPIFVILYSGYRILTDRGFWKAYGLKLMLALLVALLVYAPLGSYFVIHPDVFLRRAGEVSIFNPEKNPQGPLYSFVSSAVKIVGMYNLRGDPFWRHNLPGRPAFDFLTSICFLLGLGISVAKRKEPAYSLLLFWLVIMSLPPILTPPRDVPHFTRSIGALPAACIFPAIGVQGAWEWVRAKQSSPRVRKLFWLSVSALLVSATLLTYRDYFIIWADNSDLRDHYFDGEFLDVATAMNQLDDPEGVWILPISALASPHDETGHHTIEFMYRGQAPFHFLRLEEATAAEELSRLSRGHARALVVDYKNFVIEEAYNYIDADPKRLVPFLLSKYGQQVEQRMFDSFDVLIYELPEFPDFSMVESFEPLSVNFGAQLMLTGLDYGEHFQQHTPAAGEQEETTLPSGEYAWVVSKWRSLANLSADYKVALYLLDERERVVGQVDKLLLSNHMRLTSDWEPGQVEIDYYRLPSLPATPPGDYHIELAVYDPTTMQRLAILGSAGRQAAHSYALGVLEIVEPLSPPVVDPEQKVAEGTMVPEVRLLGYDLMRKALSPGEAVEVALYWEALRDVQKDYAIVVQVRDDEGHLWGEGESRPAYGSYPTTEWEGGEIIRDWHDVPIKAETPNGYYHLYVGMKEEGELIEDMELETIPVSGRVRTYETPAMEHELGWHLGEGVALLGYDMDGVVRAGKTLELTLYWQCLREMDESYTVFTHLLDENNVIQGQLDSIPVSGEAPTTSWIEREVITDRYEIALDTEAPAGEYLIEIGMYDPDTMQRLPAYDAQGKAQGDRILLKTVRITR